MSQTTPREFKFVDGRIRKRRKRKAQVPAAGLLVPSNKSAAVVSNFPVNNNLNDDCGRRAKQQEQQPGPREVETPNSASSDANLVALAETAEDPLVDPQLLAPQGLDDLLSWTLSPDLNPFLDRGLSSSDTFSFSSQEPQILKHQSSQAFECADLRPSSRAPELELPESYVRESGCPEPAHDEVDGQPQSQREMPHDDEAPQVSRPSLSKGRVPGSSFTRLLSQYDEEFCVLPLTSDFDANPFRYSENTSGGSRLLLHAILALSYRHSDRAARRCSDEAREHKNEALKLLERDLRLSEAKAGLLDAVLILFTLDCATSAHGPWVSHLTRAYRILETAGGLTAMRIPRARAQIEMLVWWDVTLALTSRNGCVMPESYFSRLFCDDTGGDVTSFYNISGCPYELFIHMVRLAKYAREFELASTMTCVTFYQGPVGEIEKCIKEWAAHGYRDICAVASLQNTADSNLGEDEDGAAEEKANARQDLHHCAEAWRYALLLYIERVFKWDRNGPPSPVLWLLARKTLNHVWCCRRSSMVQKQLLLPVFLAACETKDSTLRALASDYCAWWTERTRYDMFLTASALLKEVWRGTSETSWWGFILDEKGWASATESLPHQYLFG